MGKGLVALTECPFEPTNHQVEGIQKLVDYPYVFLTDEMGMGKSKQVIDAASLMYKQNIIDRVVIVTMASIVSTWADPEVGQLVTHCWPCYHNSITTYHSRTRNFTHGEDTVTSAMEWIVTNYEYIRMDVQLRSKYIPPKLAKLMERCDDRTLLVLDESSAVKSTTAAQSRACKWLRERCGRVVLLTGTPIAHSPIDLLSQANILHPSILSDRPGEPLNIFQFRSKYCVMGGFRGKIVVDYKQLEELQERLKPFTLRRLKKDCLDLPPKLEPVTLTATLSGASWKLYKDMRDHAIIELSGEVSVAQQAVRKLIRLSLLTSGFVGGVNGDSIRRTGTEKLDVLFNWVTDQLESDPCFKLVVWTQFRADVLHIAERLKKLKVKHLNKKVPVEIGLLWGQSSKNEREHALRLLHPSTAPKGAAIVIGTPQTGSMGITLAAASTVCYMNNPHSLSIRLQSEDRVHRPGQKATAVSYYQIAAVGPKGQKTMDHIILKALRSKRELATWTASAWLDELKGQKETSSGP